MDPITQQTILSAAGAGGDKIYVDDVFSADAYRGVGGQSGGRKFVNGIELGSNIGVSLNGKTITDTTGGGANYTKLINDIFSSANTDYYYSGGGTIDCYIDYGSAVVATFFDLAPQGDNTIGAVYNTPTSVTGYGSNNASSWTSLGAQSFIADSWSEGSFTSYNFLSNTTAYRYYRLTVSGSGKSLQEWRLGITDSELGKGGLVWIKNRFNNMNHVMMDTDTGVTKYLSSNTYTVTNQTGAITSYNNNGFSLGNDARVNSGGSDHIAWTFRKQPGFFDIVSWTGDGTSNRVLNHNLESKPGMMLIQCTSTSQNWFVYHHSLGATKKLVLNLTNAAANDGGDHLNNTEPTATQITLGFYLFLNASGRTYVAYLFADDDAQFGTSGNESIIKCGSYTGSGNSTDQEIDLGFEPQFLLIKYTGAAGSADWMLVDQARGFQGYPGDNFDAPSIGANASNAETYSGGKIRLTARGFKFKSEGGIQYNQSGKNYVYMAIRRPNKPPEAATEVFNAIAYLGNNSNPRIIPNSGKFSPDTIFGRRTQSSGTVWYDKIRSEDYYINPYNAEGQGQNTDYLNQFLYDGYQVKSNWNGQTSVPFNHYVFRRAPGFYDVVTYAGTGSVANHIHNLGVVPEMMIVKSRSSSENWRVYAAPLGATKALQLNGTGGVSSTSSLYWNNTAPTSSVFTVPNYDGVNGSGKSYINYMFATLPGISKIGSYTGTGNAINVDCGFTNGARYIIIKRDGTGDWYQFSTILGISNAAAPHYFFNITSYVTGTDYIDPLAAGFTVTSSAPAGLNTSGGTYIFIAFA